MHMLIVSLKCIEFYDEESIIEIYFDEKSLKVKGSHFHVHKLSS